MSAVTRRHQGKLPNRVTSRLQRQYRSYHREFPGAISAGACIWFTLLYFNFCGIASRKIGIWLTEFIKNLKLNTEKQKGFWYTRWDRSLALDNMQREGTEMNEVCSRVDGNILAN